MEKGKYATPGQRTPRSRSSVQQEMEA